MKASPSAQFDSADVGHVSVAEAAVVQALNRVVEIKAVLGLGGGFDVPTQERALQGLGNGGGQKGFARSGLSFEKQGTLDGKGDLHHFL
jgi:hypothetical protein